MENTKYSVSPRQGFTLMELMITLCILGILSGVALFSYQRSMEKTKLIALQQMGNDYITAVQSCLNKTVTETGKEDLSKCNTKAKLGMTSCTDCKEPIFVTVPHGNKMCMEMKKDKIKQCVTFKDFTITPTKVSLSKNHCTKTTYGSSINNTIPSAVWPYIKCSSDSDCGTNQTCRLNQTGACNSAAGCH